MVIPFQPVQPHKFCGPKNVAFAMIDGPRVFMLAGDEAASGKVYLLQARFVGEAKSLVFTPPRFWSSAGVETRWRIGGNACYLAMEYPTSSGARLNGVSMLRFPLEDLRDRNQSPEPNPRDGSENMKLAAWWLPGNAELMSATSTTVTSPQGQKVGFIFSGTGRGYIDFLPRGQSGLSQFVHNGTAVTCWNLPIKWDPNATFSEAPDLKGRWVGGWSRQEWFFAPEFNERFRVFELSSSHLFVTDSGKIFIARHVKEGKRKLEPLWSDAKHAAGVLISDTKSGKTFAFTKPADPKAGAKDELFFELADPIKPRPFDRTKLKPTKAPEPLHTAVQHARFLVEQKLIEGK
jgi:hypothetical protein